MPPSWISHHREYYLIPLEEAFLSYRRRCLASLLAPHQVRPNIPFVNRVTRAREHVESVTSPYSTYGVKPGQRGRITSRHSTYTTSATTTRMKNISHQPAGSEDISGLEAIKQFTAGVRQAFPDMEITLEDQIAEGDKVVTRFTSRGTHQGELWGIPATGKEVEVTSISMDRIEGGKIAEHWTHADQLGMMQQLGVVPKPGEQPSSTPSAGQEPPS
jgi:steroid delta-isomerase-like uncharacterized protein